MTSAVLGLLLGALLGLRYKVLILVPVHAAAVAFCGMALLVGVSLGAVVVAFVSWSAVCQVSYAITAVVAGLLHPPADMTRPDARRLP